MKRSRRFSFSLALLGLSFLTPEPASAQQELLKLTASDGAENDRFGVSVAISGGRAIVGCPGHDDDGPSSGSAYLFDVTTGQELLKLTASDGAENDQFGARVAISGDRAIAGAPYDGDGDPSSGSAYLFDVMTGRELFKLTASDGVTFDEFGFGVAISGDRAIVGARGDDNGRGSAYVFDVTTGQRLFKLTASDADSYDRFGESVAVSGDRAVVGAKGDDDLAYDSGAAYVFDLTTGQELFKLTASDGAASDLFGFSVAISGDRAIVGALGDDDDGSGSGSAYLFDVTTGRELFKLTASDGMEGALFGLAVAASGDRAVVGSRDSYPWFGSAYVFDVTTGRELFKLTASDGAAADYFGSSVAASGDRAIIGAGWDDDLGSNSGSAYVFLTPAQGSAFCFGDGGGSPCACGNTGGTGAGCASSAGAGGLLTAGGSDSAADDDLVLYASDLVPARPALPFAGVDPLNGGDGVRFGDGLRCAGGTTVRLGIATSDANGDVRFGPGLGAIGGWSPGDVRYFQVWYADPAGPCGSGFNLTNGIEVAFGP